MTYKCEHFKIHELVPPQVYQDRGEKAWELFDERILMAIDDLRDSYGSITINNYMYGGDREWSGLRTPDSPWYSPYSQHTFGRAVDCLFKDADVEEVRKAILADDQIPYLPDITAVELDTSWLHIDCRNTEGIKTFSA